MRAGWTVLTPAPDTRILYVSSSEGSDSGGYRYSTVDEVGGDAFNPLPGTYEPYATIQAAYNDLRDGKPDWILLRRGDEWNFGSGTLWWGKDGPASDRRQVLSAYGPIQEPRPKLVFDSPGISLGNGAGNQRNLVFAHLHFYAPDSDTNSDANAGIAALIINDTVSEIANILIEGCWFDYCRRYPISFQNQSGSEKFTNVVLRRNIVSDTYSSTIYLSGYDDVTLEENVFIDSGIRQSLDNPDGQGLDAQCLYLQDGSAPGIDNAIVVGNIFVNVASTAVQARSGGRVNRNLFVRCPMFGALGTDHYEYDGLDIGEALDNVIVNSNDMPANRGSRGWGIQAVNLSSGLVSGNIMASNEGNFPKGISMGASAPQVDPGSVQIIDNIVYNFRHDSLLFENSGGLMSAHVDGNIFYDGVSSLPSDASWVDLLVRSRESSHADNENYTFGTNYYYGNSALWPESSWFDLEASGAPGINSLNEWLAYSGDQGGLQSSDPWTRSESCAIEGYLAAIGGDDWDTYAEWKAKLVEQRLGAWDALLEARVAINWFRTGFGKDPIGSTNAINFGGRGAASSFIIFGG